MINGDVDFLAIESKALDRLFTQLNSYNHKHRNSNIVLLNAPRFEDQLLYQEFYLTFSKNEALSAINISQAIATKIYENLKIFSKNYSIVYCFKDSIRVIINTDTKYLQNYPVTYKVTLTLKVI